MSPSPSGIYLYGVLRRQLPCVRSVNGFPVATVATVGSVLILRMNGHRICVLFSVCKVTI